MQGPCCDGIVPLCTGCMNREALKELETKVLKKFKKKLSSKNKAEWKERLRRAARDELDRLDARDTA